MLFVRWNDLTDRLVGRTARGERPVIRWPKAVAVFKEGCNEVGIGAAMVTIGGLLPLLIPAFTGLFIALLAGAFVLVVGVVLVDIGRDKKTERSKIVSQLFSKDPCIDLRAAAFLTVGAMPEWLRAQMDSERTPDWQKTRLAEEPYTVERAGLDYLELASSIELWGKPPCGSFHGKSFPSIRCYKLPDSLKAIVVEIVLFLSSLPDAEEPDGETVEAVIDAIDRLATIDGESFTEAVRRLHEEEEDKKKAAEDKARADYNGGIMKLVDATRNTLAVRNDEQYKALMHGMDKLSKLGERTAGSVDANLAATVSPTK